MAVLPMPATWVTCVSGRYPATDCFYAAPVPLVKGKMGLTNNLGRWTLEKNPYLRRRTLAYNGFHRRP